RDCSGCHMPKRDLREIQHAALTNHRIVRQQDEPYPEEAFRLTTPTLPNLIHVSAILGREAESVPPLTLLQAYRTLSSSHREFEEPYEKLLSQLSESEPDDPLVLAALAQRVTSSTSSQTPQARSDAIRYLSRAIQLGSTEPNDFLLLDDLLARSGRVSEGVAVLTKGILLTPYVKELYQSMATRLISMGKHTEALDTIKKGLEFFPGDTRLNTLLREAKPPSNGSSHNLP